MATTPFLETFEKELRQVWEQDNFDSVLKLVREALVKSYRNGISRGKRESMPSVSKPESK